MTAARIDLHIEELLLDGIAAADRAAVGAAVRRELARLLAEGGLAPSLAGGGARPALDGGSFAIAPGATADAIGAQVARAVYGGIGREPA